MLLRYPCEASARRLRIVFSTKIQDSENHQGHARISHGISSIKSLGIFEPAKFEDHYEAAPLRATGEEAKGPLRSRPPGSLARPITSSYRSEWMPCGQVSDRRASRPSFFHQAGESPLRRRKRQDRRNPPWRTRRAGRVLFGPPSLKSRPFRQTRSPAKGDCVPLPSRAGAKPLPAALDALTPAHCHRASRGCIPLQPFPS